MKKINLKKEEVTQTSSWRGSWPAQVAGLSSFISPALGMVSTTVGYSWRINVTKAMVAANIGGVVGFAGSLFGIFGGYKDYTERQANIAAEMQAKPIIRDSGINKVTCIVGSSHDYQSGYYLRRENEMTWVTVVQEDETRENFLLEDNDPGVQLLLPMIDWPSGRNSKVIEGNLGMAFVNLIESHPQYPRLALAPIEQIAPAQMSDKQMLAYGGIVLLQVIAAGLCLGEGVGYGYSLATSSNDTINVSEGYIDPILPEKYVLASTVMKTFTIFGAAIMAYYQSHELKALENTHSNRIQATDNKQTIANEKQRIKETVGCVCAYTDKMHSIRRRCELLFKRSSEMHPDALKDLLINELKEVREVLDTFDTELQRSEGKISQPILRAIKDSKLKLQDFSQEVENIEITGIEQTASLRDELSKIFVDEFVQIENAFRMSFLAEISREDSQEDQPRMSSRLASVLSINFGD